MVPILGPLRSEIGGTYSGPLSSLKYVVPILVPIRPELGGTYSDPYQPAVMNEETAKVIATRSTAPKCGTCNWKDSNWSSRSGVVSKGPYKGLIIPEGLWRCEGNPHHVVCGGCIRYVDINEPDDEIQFVEMPEESGMYCVPCINDYGEMNGISWKREVAVGRYCAWAPNKRRAA